MIWIEIHIIQDNHTFECILIFFISMDIAYIFYIFLKFKIWIHWEKRGNVDVYRGIVSLSFLPAVPVCHILSWKSVATSDTLSARADLPTEKLCLLRKE